jgi:hypothetical protein
MASRARPPLSPKARSGKSAAAARWLHKHPTSSFRAAGERFGVTTQGVQQMWSALGYEPRANWSPSSERRSIVINLRITRTEFSQWSTSAARAKTSLSEWLRDAAAGKLLPGN